MNTEIIKDRLGIIFVKKSENKCAGTNDEYGNYIRKKFVSIKELISKWLCNFRRNKGLMKYSFCLFLLFLSSAAQADWIGEYVRYESIPDLGKISISAHSFSGGDNLDAVDNKWQEFATKDIFLPIAKPEGAERTFVRDEVLGGVKVKVIITMLSPSGNGMCGALGNAKLQIFINKKKRVEIDIGSGSSSSCYGSPEVYSVDVLLDHGSIISKVRSAEQFFYKSIFIESEEVLNMDSFVVKK